MFGMGGFDPKKMQAMLKQMGIKQEQIVAERVVIECADKKIVIENPEVSKMIMKGQTSWQIAGEEKEESIEEEIKDEDVEMVAGKAGVSREKARKALEAVDGDIARAITELSE